MSDLGILFEFFFIYISFHRLYIILFLFFLLAYFFYIDDLTCYGFRGEALSSICAVADVTIITKSESDEYARSFTMDSNGYVKNSCISHHQNGL